MAGTVSSTELVKFLGVHRRTLDGWMEAGCPVAKKARPGEKGGHQFVSKDVIKWLNDRAVTDALGDTDSTTVSVEEARRRKMLAEAGLQEIELAKKKGLVVELDSLERKLSHVMAQLSSSFRKIPNRAAMRITGETDETAIKKVLMEEVDLALNALADLDHIDIDELNAEKEAKDAN